MGCFFSFVTGIGIFATIYLTPLFLARVRGFSALQIGEAVFTTGLFQVCAIPFYTVLARRIDLRWLMMFGLACFAVSMWNFTPITHDWGWRELLLPQAFRGFSQQFAVAPTVTLTLGGLAPERLKLASGLFNLMRNLGGAIGIAACGTILNDRTNLHFLRLAEHLNSGNPAMLQLPSAGWRERDAGARRGRAAWACRGAEALWSLDTARGADADLCRRILRHRAVLRRRDDHGAADAQARDAARTGSGRSLRRGQLERRNATAAVIGAGDFIGSAIARKFAAEGFTVFAGRRNGEKLAPLVHDIEAKGGRVVARSLDARQEDAIAAFLRAADEEAPLEVCIFNVGANVNFPLVDTTERVFRKVWEMACYAGFLAGREAARLMLPHGRGAIFFTGATASLRGGAGYAAFAAAKAGLRAVAQSAARELGPKNIHVAHLVIDAGVDTAWVRERIRAREGDEAVAQSRSQPADAAGLGRGGLLAALSAATRCVDVRDGYPAVWREVVMAHAHRGIPLRLRQSECVSEPSRDSRHRARTGARFVYVPVLLGGVFKLTNNRSPAESWRGSGTSRNTSGWRPAFPAAPRHHAVRAAIRSFQSTRWC